MFKNLRITTKIVVSIALFGFLIIVLIGMSLFSIGDIEEFSVSSYESTLMEASKNELKTAVHISAQTFGSIAAEYSTVEEKIEAIRKYNNPIRFFDNKSGYFFVYNKQGICISLPPKQSLQGESLIHLKDKNDVFIVKDMATAALNGGGFVSYLWPKEGKEDDQPKLSYAQNIPGTDWWMGTGVYIDDIEEKKQIFLGNLNDKSDSLLTGTLLFVLLFFVALVIPLVFLLIKYIVMPIKEITKVAAHAQNGDFSNQINYTSKDELGELAETFRLIAKRQQGLSIVAQKIAKGDLNTRVDVHSDKDILGLALKQMIHDLSVLVKEIVNNTHVLSDSSQNLSSISGKFVESFEEINNQTVSAASASNEISANISTMASGTEELSSNIQSISASSTELSQNTIHVLKLVEEIFRSITDISKKSENASEIARDAKDMSQNATKTMKGLDESANEIGAVTEMIKEIAQQTNLLALNANIEAASAGEAGKGFAVVANEIKELAKQSSKAATSIGEKIGMVQEKTTGAVGIIDKMSDTVGTIAEASSDITELTFKQTESANVMTSNMKEASSGIDEITKMIAEMASAISESSRNSSELSQSAHEISKNVTLLSDTSKESARDTVKIQTESEDLSSVVASLKNLMQRFKLSDS